MEDIDKIRAHQQAQRNGILAGFQAETITEPTEVIEKGDVNDIEKSRLADALTYQSDIKFKKTGAELKTAINAAITAAETRAQVHLTAANDMVGELPHPPFQEVSRFRYGKAAGTIDVKGYPWELTDWNQDKGCCYGLDYLTDTVKACAPSTAEEAGLYRTYNRLVNDYVDCLNEVQMLGVYARNLVDTENYTLQPELLHQLGL